MPPPQETVAAQAASAPQQPALVEQPVVEKRAGPAIQRPAADAAVAPAPLEEALAHAHHVPRPRPLPRGFRRTADSDDGFNLPKSRRLEVTALKKFHEAVAKQQAVLDQAAGVAARKEAAKEIIRNKANGVDAGADVDEEDDEDPGYYDSHEDDYNDMVRKERLERAQTRALRYGFDPNNLPSDPLFPAIEEEDEEEGDVDEDEFDPDREVVEETQGEFWPAEPNDPDGCEYSFMGSRYEGHIPVAGKNITAIEFLTKYRPPGGDGTWLPIPGGHMVPRVDARQLSDARAEISRRRQERLGISASEEAMLIESELSGSDYGATQAATRARGRLADSELEVDDEASSPVKPASKKITPADKGKGKASAEGPSTEYPLLEARGRRGLKEAKECQVLGGRIHAMITEAASRLNRDPALILKQCKINGSPSRESNIWNGFQTLYSLVAPDMENDRKCPRDMGYIVGLRSDMFWVAIAWRRNMKTAYSTTMRGLSKPEREAAAAAIQAELATYATNPDLVEKPLARMKRAITELGKVRLIFRVVILLLTDG